MTRWVVVTGDVIGSRHIQPHERMREAVSAALDSFNRTWAQDIAVPFSMAVGDELQGVVEPGPASFAMVRRLRSALRRAPLSPPVRLRVGIGWGTIDTPFSSIRSWEMDGQAFHLAGRALAQAGRAGGRGREVTRFAGPDPQHEAWVNLVLGLLDAIMERWTPEQWEAVGAYERLGTYAAAAHELGIAFQNVQKRCAAARWPLVREAETFLGRTLAAPGPPAEGSLAEGSPALG